jgi:adenylate kinase
VRVGVASVPQVNLVIFGAPGSGKGTQADLLASKLGIPKISTGDILRAAIKENASVGAQAMAAMAAGDLVSEEIVVEMVRQRLSMPDAGGGFILDGFPRTVSQAHALDRILRGRRPLVIVELEVPTWELLRRMELRRVCSRCGSNLKPDAPISDACGACGGAMTTRADDGNDDVRLYRLDVYVRQTSALLDYYGQRETFRSVDGTQRVDQVTADLAAAIRSALAHART